MTFCERMLLSICFNIKRYICKSFVLLPTKGGALPPTLNLQFRPDSPISLVCSKLSERISLGNSSTNFPASSLLLLKRRCDWGLQSFIFLKISLPCPLPRLDCNFPSFLAVAKLYGQFTQLCKWLISLSVFTFCLLLMIF